MPAVIIDPTHVPATSAKELYFKIPLVGNQKADDVDLRKINPDNLIMVQDPVDAHVVKWHFNGSVRVFRFHAKALISEDEIRFLATKGLAGLIKPIDDGLPVDESESTKLLAEQVRVAREAQTKAELVTEDIRRELIGLRARYEDAERRAIAAEARLSDALNENRSHTAALEALRSAAAGSKPEVVEKLKLDLVRLQDLVNAHAELDAKAEAIAKDRNARIVSLEKDLTEAKAKVAALEAAAKKEKKTEKPAEKTADAPAATTTENKEASKT